MNNPTETCTVNLCPIHPCSPAFDPDVHCYIGADFASLAEAEAWVREVVAILASASPRHYVGCVYAEIDGPATYNVLHLGPDAERWAEALSRAEDNEAYEARNLFRMSYGVDYDHS